MLECLRIVSQSEDSLLLTDYFLFCFTVIFPLLFKTFSFSLFLKTQLSLTRMRFFNLVFSCGGVVGLQRNEKFLFPTTHLPFTNQIEFLEISLQTQLSHEC